jgi:23S rRNA (adenine2503-C2)-methyltransferase
MKVATIHRVFCFFYFWAMPAGDLKDLSEAELKDFFTQWGEKSFRIQQIIDWMYNHNVKTFAEMTNLSQALRDRLEKECKLRTLEVVRQDASADGTVKWLYKTHDGYFIETVLIPSEERNSVCVSTQVGCGMGCTFCRTSKMGLKRHLSSGEILEQFINTRVFLREFDRNLTNIIFMGMGEPFHNYDNVKKTIEWLHDRKTFNLGAKRITVSTSGIVPKIRQMADDNLTANLALSLNGTNDEMRSRTMPINNRWPMTELLDAVDYYIRKTGEHVTLEYVLIKGITCTPQAARELLSIIRNRRVKMNAIALNDGDDPTLRCPDPEEIEEFLTIVRQAGKHITVRQPRGRDIKAACGQLAHHQQKVA